LIGPSTAARLIGWAGRPLETARATALTLITLTPATPAQNARKISPKFKPLILGEVHTVGNTIRVEPISTYLERRRKGPIHPVIVSGETVYVSGLLPFDPKTGAKPEQGIRSTRS